MNVELTADGEGVLVSVQAQPGARKNAIVGEHAGRLKVSVTQVAERGKANDALLEVLAEGLDLRRSQVRLVSGAVNSRKVFRIAEMSVDELRERIARVLAERDR